MDLEPKDMPSFLNDLAMKIKDEDTRDKIIQCSLFIHVINSMCKKE